MKLLATDYDGTLRYAQDVMPEDLKSIEEWKNKEQIRDCDGSF